MMVDVVKKNPEVFGGLGRRIVPSAQRDRSKVGPLLVSDHKGIDRVTARVLTTPVNLYRPEFWGRNLHAKDYAESGYNIRLELETRAGSADGEEIVGVGGILSGLKEVVVAPSAERMKNRG
jgi:hypothetical protein